MGACAERSISGACAQRTTGHNAGERRKAREKSRSLDTSAFRPEMTGAVWTTQALTQGAKLRLGLNRSTSQTQTKTFYCR